MIKFKKIVAALAISLVGLTCLPAAKVHATTNTDIDWNNKLTSGRDIYFWVSSDNWYTDSIDSAKRKLRYPSGLYNPIVLNRTTTKTSSKMDIYQYKSADGSNAYAQCFRKNSSGTYYNSTGEKDKYDWVYGKIYINDKYMRDYNVDLRSTVILHEMLHIYGCKDIANTNSTMYYATPKVRSLTKDANTVLNNKY